MISGLRIREATQPDIAQVKNLVDSHRHELGFVPRPALERSLASGWLRVAEVDGRVAGAINWWTRKDGVAVVYNVVVEPSEQCRGVGRALVQDLLEWAKRSRVSRIVLKCPEDLLANSFYAKLGFAIDLKESGKQRALNVWALDLPSGRAS